MSFCLLPKHRDAFKEALRKGEITPEKLNAMTTAERTAFFAERFGGEANGKAIERALEMKHLNKNVETGMVRWAERLIDVPNDYKTDLISRIRKMSAEGGLLDMKSRETLLDEVIEYRTGKKISPDEAKTITEMSASLNEAEVKWKAEENDVTRMEYGSQLVAYEKYIGSLESAAKKRDYFTFMREEGLLGKTGGAVSDVLNLAKNLNQASRQVKATFDNSFFFRQFRKAWRPGSAGFAKTELFKAVGNTVKTLGGGKNAGERIVNAVKAEVWSRQNAKNGRYFTKDGQLDLGRLKEETTPETFLEDIPAIGRGFVASRVANEAAAIRLRADIADMFYGKAEKKGVDLSDPANIADINNLVNSMTGRGKIKGMGEGMSKTMNELFFSPKFAKATLDTFTQPLTLKTKFGRTEALYNLVSLAGTSAFVLSVANLFGAKTETDPTSSDFGQARYGDTRIDATGGVRGMATLLSRLFSVMADKPIKSAKTGISKVSEGFTEVEPLDLVVDFAENKVAPLMGLLLDMSVGKTFEGKPLTLAEGIKSLFLPIIVDTGYSATEADGIATGIAATVADFFGASASTYQYSDNWETKTSKEMVGFKKKVGDSKFNQANEEYNEKIRKFLNSPAYEKASNEEKGKLLDKEKAKAKKEVMWKRGYKP